MELLSGRDRHSRRTREHITRPTGESCEEGARSLADGNLGIGLVEWRLSRFGSPQSETRKRPKDGRGRRNCPKCPFNSVGRRSEGDLNAAENEHLPIGQNRQGQRQRDSVLRSALNRSDAENSGGRPDLNGRGH